MEILAAIGWLAALSLGGGVVYFQQRARAMELELLSLKARSTELGERLEVISQERDGAMHRARQEAERLRKFGQEKLLKGLLPVIDNLELALSSSAKGQGLHQGVRMVASQFIHELSRHGLQVFDALDELFDPALHEAIDRVPRSDLPPGTVIRQGRRGVLLHERLLRPAQVVVSCAPPKPDEAPVPVEDEVATDPVEGRLGAEE